MLSGGVLRMAVVQERTASPFRCTVQQPHRAMPQPYFVPVKADHVANHPEKRRAFGHVDGVRLSIHGEFVRHGVTSENLRAKTQANGKQGSTGAGGCQFAPLQIIVNKGYTN